MLKKVYGGVLWAMEHRLRNTNHSVALQIRALREEMEHEFGFLAVVASHLLGPVLWFTSLREDKRLARGQRYEPETMMDRRNWVET
jgi:hypothetical protein